jgi:hypothetical protein
MDNSYIAYSRTYEYQKYFMKKYYNKNRESILAYKKQKYNCDCGSYICIGDKAKHNKTKKHIDFIKSTEITSLNISTELSLASAHSNQISL